MACALLAQAPGISHCVYSGVHGFTPVGGPAGQMDFLNAVARCETSLTPQELLDRLKEIERQMGRMAGPRWGPRTIDLDLLLYDLLHYSSPTLTIPHPRFAFRKFVLEPALEVAWELVHPEIGWNLAQLVNHVRTAPPLITILGQNSAAAAALASKVGQHVGGEVVLAKDHASDRDRAAHVELLLAKGGTVLTDFWLENLPPKLIAALDVPHPEAFAIVDLSDPAAEKLRELSLRCYAPGRGPTLSLSAADAAWTEEDLVAAVYAMR
jgi:2-amino-4-hydroxy-6-hydroxymethyldihydropteridine diphosphokinase